jgi:uncharacterized protein YndB with AHSA1/START domain
MPIVSRHQDVRARSLTLVAHYAARPEAVWELWASPRRLERWWGPAGFTMTVETFELRTGGEVRFHVVGSDGQVIAARFDVLDVAPPARLRFDFTSDGLETTRIDVAIEELAGGGSSMTMTATFSSDAVMEHAFDIGVDAGFTAALERAEAVSSS